jgi:glycosyltransferase involved in cell wall biosynthesis
MYFGVPVVATQVGGIPEVIIDGESGLLVDPGNSRALAMAITWLLDDPGLQRQLITGGLTAGPAVYRRKYGPPY